MDTGTSQKQEPGEEGFQGWRHFSAPSLAPRTAFLPPSSRMPHSPVLFLSALPYARGWYPQPFAFSFHRLHLPLPFFLAFFILSFHHFKSHILTLSLMCKCAHCATPYPLSRLPFHLPNVLLGFP